MPILLEADQGVSGTYTNRLVSIMYLTVIILSQLLVSCVMGVPVPAHEHNLCLI